jgi:acetyl esterase
MMDRNTRDLLPGLDAEMTAYVRFVDGFYPPDATTLDTAGQRAVYDRMCAELTRSYPAGIVARDETVAGRSSAIPVRRYTSEAATAGGAIVYLHGGGFVVGGLHSHDSVCAELCVAAAAQVIAVDYRLSPEHVHPAHVEDAVDAFRALAAEHRRVLVAGDSAGGALAAAVALTTRGELQVPVGQLLIYPGLGGERLGLGSYCQHAEAIHLTAKDVAYYANVRAGGTPPWHDPLFAPLLAEDLSGMPPCVAISADIDPLRDDCAEWVRRLRAAGVVAEHVNEPGLVHGFLRARLMSARAQAAFDRIGAAARRLIG